MMVLNMVLRERSGNDETVAMKKWSRHSPVRFVSRLGQLWCKKSKPLDTKMGSSEVVSANRLSVTQVVATPVSVT